MNATHIAGLERANQQFARDDEFDEERIESCSNGL